MHPKLCSQVKIKHFLFLTLRNDAEQIRKMHPKLCSQVKIKHFLFLTLRNDAEQIRKRFFGWSPKHSQPILAKSKALVHAHYCKDPNNCMKLMFYAQI